jgi:hypothetical protein
VLGLRFSDNGRTLDSSGSKSVIAWDLEGSRRLGRPFFPSAGPVPYGLGASLGNPHALAISPDGALLAAPVASAPDHIALIDLHSPRLARQPLAPGIGRSRRWRSVPTAGAWPWGASRGRGPCSSTSAQAGFWRG